jgi:hypothetical protein
MRWLAQKPGAWYSCTNALGRVRGWRDGPAPPNVVTRKLSRAGVEGKVLELSPAIGPFAGVLRRQTGNEQHYARELR